MAGSTTGAAPPPPIDVGAAPTDGLFNLTFFDWTYPMNGRMCKAPDCSNAIDHMCLPGPPDDLIRMALRSMYAG